MVIQSRTVRDDFSPRRDRVAIHESSGRVIRRAGIVAVGLVLASTCAVAPPAWSNAHVDASQVQSASEAPSPPIEEDGPERAAWQQSFDQAAQRLREAYPDDFAFSRVDGPSAGTIGFAERVPDNTSGAFDGLPSGVTVTGDAGYSERQLEESSLALLEIAGGKTSDDVELATYVDWTDEAIHLVYGGQGIASTAMATTQKVSNSLRDQAEVPSEFGLSIDYRNETMSGQEGYSAGYSLDRYGAYRCSSAFPV